ncbi:MAG: sugar ABC transporter permease [Clostridia bacterium]|nr:sugar ABC transporter permease [Clostridia bacterium]
MFLEDEVFLISVKNTLIFALFTGPISYFLCLFLAWLINDYPRHLRAVLTLVFYAPSMTGSAYIVWNYIFSGDMYGLLNGMLMKLGIISDPVQWLTDTKYMMIVVIIVQLWLSLGAGFLAFIAGLQNIDKSMYEVGAIEGIRNRWQELFYITLPSMGPQLLFGAVMQISTSFAAGSVSMQLTGFPSTDYATHTIVLHAQDYGFTRYEMGYASAICFVLFVFMLLVNELIRGILKRFTD